MSDPSNDQYIQKQQTEAMLKAGIGFRYHSKSLDSIPAGREIKALILEGDLITRINQGGGLTIVAGSVENMDIFPLLAKGLMLGVNMGALLSNPMKVIDAYESGWVEMMDRIKTVQCLFLSTFIDDGECPFNKSQRYRIEQIILERSVQHRATFLDVYEGCKLTDWWSKKFVEQMSQINREIIT